MALIGIIIGIPSFIYTFKAGNLGLGISLIAVTCLFIAFIIFRRWEINQPRYTILKTEYILNILAADGSSSKLTKRQNLKCNHSGCTEHIHRNLSADGTIQNFDTDYGRPLVEREAGDYIVIVRFDQALKKGARSRYLFDL